MFYYSDVCLVSYRAEIVLLMYLQNVFKNQMEKNQTFAICIIFSEKLWFTKCTNAKCKSNLY